jgi:ABC-2 type transport system permease protein
MASLRNILTIAGKELRGYFGSPVAWVTMGLFAVIFAGFFTVYLEYFVRSATQSQFGGPPPPVSVNENLIRPLLQNASVIVLFMLPMITMRSYAEEKRSGTIEFLLTAPVTDFEIVLAKFASALGLYVGLLAITMVYVGVVFALGSPDWRPVLVGYAGLLLLGACFLSLGLFISSTTKNQMLAGAATFVVSLLFWIAGWFSESSGPTMGAVLNYLSITSHFEDFSKGVIDTKHVTYYLSFIVFSLFLTLKSVDTERWRG